ncbi:MAG: 4Fe-4S binding protein [Clostridia bacterium]|nr:4Fe-4S binding protein [Clostridia bacterium]
MAYFINKDLCIGCGSCAAECPIEAIKAGEDGKYVINADDCIDCGTCASVCPVEAPASK